MFICRWGLEISTLVFRRAWKSIYILKRKRKTVLKPDMVNTNQSRWLLPLLLLTRPGKRLAGPHLPKPVQELAALQGRASQEPWVAAGQTRTGTLPTGPHPIADSGQGRSGDGDQGQPRVQ